MSESLDHLVVDGNEAVEIKLVRNVEDIGDENTSFPPEMCHQVFGENENIFGYTDLKIKLYYTAGILNTYLGIQYSEKIDPTKSHGLKADDVEGALQKILPRGYLKNKDLFISSLNVDKQFIPYGTLIHSRTMTSEPSKRTFEVYFSEISTPSYIPFHERLQTFLMWYVDAASFIDADDDQWNFFTIYEKYQSSEGDTRYATVGYATVYRYYAYPHHSRPRISQVLILPPFRSMGLCAELLQAIYLHYMSQSEVIDITVEDPSEEFQRIRDFVDVKNCATLPGFQPAKLMNGFSHEMYSQARYKFKINKKQARRVYEILRLKYTNTSDKTAYLSYRLDVKNRLNAPFQKKKLDMKKLARVLKPEEYAATLSASGAGETHARLAAHYQALEPEYRRVLHRLQTSAFH